MSNYKHLTLTQRNTIELLLNKNYNLIAIATIVNKDPRTISKEINRNRYLVLRKNAKNSCGLFNDCSTQRLCTNCETGFCKFCTSNSCSTLCNSFSKYPNCKTINRFPFVCNGCDTIKDCKLPKLFYKAQTAHDNYIFNVSNHKKGVRLSKDTLDFINKKVSSGVANNLSLDVIINSFKLPISLTSLYNIIHLNLIDTKDMDLKRKVSFKKRFNKKHKSSDLIYDYRSNRTYQDYLSYVKNNPNCSVWQMDTIEGTKGMEQNAILSLFHLGTSIQLYFKINSISQSEVISVLNKIKKHLSVVLFKELFEVILTDNGKEFKDPISMAKDLDTDEILSKIFYCDSRRSDQKAECEKNHTIFRECLPKGYSINPYTDTDIKFISNQVNNYIRKSLGYCSPLHLATKVFDPKVLALNNLKVLQAHKVKLTKILK